MADRLHHLKGGFNYRSGENSSSSKLELPDGMNPESLLSRRRSTSITANLLETLPSKMQLSNKDSGIATENQGLSGIQNATSNKSDNHNPKFNSFLRRSSAAFIGDLSRIKPGAINGSSIPEETSDILPTDNDQNGPSSSMRRASIQPGVNMFQKEGMKSRGNLLSTVNGNFTAATRNGLLSNSGIQC